MGKIYGGLLILENWKTSRFGAVVRPGVKVRKSLAALELGSPLYIYLHKPPL